MCGAVGDFFYVVGGFSGAASVEKLNLARMDQWTDGPELPYILSEAASVVYQDSLILIGGNNGSVSNEIIMLNGSDPSK